MLVHVIEAWHLNEPADVVRVQLVVHDPFGKLVPLVSLPAVNADTPFTILLNLEHVTGKWYRSNVSYLILLCSRSVITSKLTAVSAMPYMPTELNDEMYLS